MLLSLTYRPADFKVPDSRLQSGEKTLRFSTARLVRAAVTVGREGWGDVFGHHDSSWLEVAWRLAMMLSAVGRTSSNRLDWTAAYRFMDPSEKGAVSYFMGMNFAKLMSEKLLAVPWLQHLDVYRDRLDPCFVAGETRPDLVGRDVNQRWIAMESKGRAGNLKQAGWLKAKWQLQNLHSLDGELVHLRVASVLFPRRAGLNVDFRDPDSADRGFDLPITPGDFITDYYSRLRRLIGESPEPLIFERPDGRPLFIGRYVPGADLFLGLAEEIYDSSSDYEAATQYASERAKSVAREPTVEETDSGASVGLDGVIVILGNSWSEWPSLSTGEPTRSGNRLREQ
jgi:hypothetical protein